MGSSAKIEICFPFEDLFVCSRQTEGIFENRGTLIFLHGTLSEAAMWGPVVELLSDRYRSIAVDFPGYGRSFSMDALEEARGMKFTDHVRLACALVDQALGSGSRRIFLVGHEWGGAVALVAALRRRQIVSGIILVNSRALTQGGAEYAGIFGRVFLRRRVLRLLSAAPGIGSEFRQQMLGMLRDPLLSKARVQFLKMVERTRPAQTSSSSEFLKPAIEALLLWGKQDLDLSRFGSFEELSRIFPDAPNHTHESAGHWLQLEAPDWVAHRIREFIFRVEQNPPIVQTALSR